jgi:hypothetical protein
LAKESHETLCEIVVVLSKPVVEQLVVLSKGAFSNGRASQH